jgi:hypothetical protein
MSTQRRPTYEAALERFLRSECPLCGRGKGDPKGIEERKNMADIYCHTCRRSWTTPVVLNLKHELRRNGVSGAPVEDLTEPFQPLAQTATPSLAQRILSRISALVGK